MRLIPKYTVSYKGTFHKAGVPFDIDDADSDMMAAHGKVEVPEASPDPDKPAKKGGRPRKVDA